MPGWTRIAGLLPVAVVLLLAAPQGRAETIALRGDEWCPYNCQPDSDFPGYVVEIVQAVFVPAGHAVDYRIAPRARSFADLRQGLISGVIGATAGEAAGLVLPREPVGREVSALAVRRGGAHRYHGPDSLTGWRLGTTEGSSYGTELDRIIADGGVAVEPVAGDRPIETNLRKLLAGRIDAVLDDGAVLTTKLVELGFADRIEVLPIGGGEAIFIAFSPADPQAASLAGRLDAGVAELRRSGRLAMILDRYGLSDWQ